MLTITRDLPVFVNPIALAAFVLVSDTAPAGDGTLELLDSSGESVATGTATATATGATATLDLSAADYGNNFLAVWEITIDGLARYIRQDVSVVKARLYPTVGLDDLTSIIHDLARQAPATDPVWAAKIEAAWVSIMSRLIGHKSFPQFVLNAWALREPHLYQTLALITADLATRENGEGRWSVAADKFAAQAEKAYGNLTLEMDTDEDDTADTTEAAVPMLLLMRPAGA